MIWAIRIFIFRVEKKTLYFYASPYFYKKRCYFEILYWNTHPVLIISLCSTTFCNQFVSPFCSFAHQLLNMYFQFPCHLGKPSINLNNHMIWYNFLVPNDCPKISKWMWKYGYIWPMAQYGPFKDTDTRYKVEIN